MRNMFAKTMCELAACDERIVLIASDIGNNLFNDYKAQFPDRFYNCGIAEALLTGLAAGMAMSGLKPVTYTIAAFNPGRCVEQIRLDICLQNLPVVVVGTGAGLSYSSLGPTHHALDDIAAMRALPNMRVVCPADRMETRLGLIAAVNENGPCYVRLGKKNEPDVHNASVVLQVGKGLWLQGQADVSTDVTILSVGTVAPLALDLAESLRTQHVTCGVVSLHTVKPLDTVMLDMVFAHSRAVLVMEEHGPVGGAWAAVAEWLAERPQPAKARLLRCGTPDAFLTQGGDQNWAQQHFGLDVRSAIATVLSALA